MHVQVISSVNEACSANFHHKTAVVIDVLRATSTIATALSAGAASIVPAETVMDARSLQRPEDIMAGERFCRKIAGFDLGNSPKDFHADAVKGRRIILTTTNGTRAIHKSTKADNVIAASLLNAAAAAKYALHLQRDVVMLCAGSHDDFAIEDGLCAGLLIEELLRMREGKIELDDFGFAMHALFRDRAAAIGDTLLQSQSGKRLIKLGLREDIETCSCVNLLQAVPCLSGDSLILRNLS